MSQLCGGWAILRVRQRMALSGFQESQTNLQRHALVAKDEPERTDLENMGLGVGSG